MAVCIMVMQRLDVLLLKSNKASFIKNIWKLEPKMVLKCGEH
jgi:hypothetical protein